MPDIPGWSSIGSSDLVAIKFVTAAAAAALLTLKLRRGATGVWERRFDLALICLALLAAASWWNLGRFHFSNYWHRHELFHYYLATKYQAELGYTRLYDCVALAERDSDPSPKLLTRWTRDLRTNEVVAGAPALRDPSLCRPHFSSERWAAFQKDVLFFRGSVSASKWMQMQRDHGYNGTPVWTMLGHALANTGPATRFQITALTLLDPLLLLVMWATVWWAFGWRVTAIALIWWGTNYPARFNYIGGAFLRSDYLVTMVVSLVLAKKGRMFASGLAFGLATLFRVFPGFAAIGLILNQIPKIRGMARGQVQIFSLPIVRFVGACALMAALLVPASGAFVGGGPSGIVDAWSAFVANSRKHLSGYSTNRVGLKTAVAYDPRSRFVDIGSVYYIESPGDTWQVARHRAFGQRWPLYWILVAVYVVLLARAVRGQPEWVALVMGLGLLPVISNITCYYYGFFLAYAFLWQRYPWIGPALCALSAYTCLVVAVVPSEEDVYAAISYGLIFYTFAVTGRLAWENGRSVTSAEPITPDVSVRPA